MATPAAATAVSTPAHRPPGRHFSVVGAGAVGVAWLLDATGCEPRAWGAVGSCGVATTLLPE
eukprot:1864759-Pleurochrysis_carterae.AAC.1